MLGGYTGAVLLGGFALVMAGESVARLLAPAPIAFDWAIAVALLGGHGNGHDHHHHGHHDHGHHHHHGGTDFNLRSAYLHVLADALTSVLAIVALLAGKYLGAAWLDPAMGIVGAILVAHWAWGLLRDTGGGVLLDRQAPGHVREALREAIEGETGDRLADVHVWAIGPDLYAVALSVVTHEPRDPDYKALLPTELGIVHATVEVHECKEQPASRARAVLVT